MKGITQPTHGQCKNCIDIADTWGKTIPDCLTCPYENEVEVVGYHYGFLAGSTATVIDKHGNIENIPTDRLKIDIDIPPVVCGSKNKS